jgi:hypothetical protein
MFTNSQANTEYSEDEIRDYLNLEHLALQRIDLPEVKSIITEILSNARLVFPWHKGYDGKVPHMPVFKAIRSFL